MLSCSHQRDFLLGYLDLGCPGARRLRCYAGEFPMPGPNADQPVTTPAAESATRFSNLLASKLDPEARKARANRAGMEALLLALRQQEDTIRQGGGAKAIEAQHGKKRLTARERLDCCSIPGRNSWSWVCSPPMACMRSGAAPRRRGRDWPGPGRRPPGDGHCQRRHGQSRRLFPHDGEKGPARPDHCPGKSDSDPLPGRFLRRFLPLQEDVFPDQDDFGRIFRNNAVMSAKGFRRSRPSWACAWPGERICRS